MPVFFLLLPVPMKTLRRPLPALLLALGATLSAFAPAAMAQDGKTLRLGIDPNYPPMDSKTPDGKLAGFDVDLGNEICRRLNTHCQWVELEFSGMIPALQARKIDGIMSTMAITEKRLKQIDFSNKLFQFKSRLVARKGVQLQASADGLHGKRLGVQAGSQFESYALAHWQKSGVTVVAYQGQDQVLADLVNGRIDAVLLGAVEAEYGFLKKPQGRDFAFVGEPISLGDRGVGIGLRKASVDLKARIDAAIAEMRRDGTYQRIAAKYFDFDVYGG